MTSSPENEKTVTRLDLPECPASSDSLELPQDSDAPNRKPKPEPPDIAAYIRFIELFPKLPGPRCTFKEGFKPFSLE